MTEMLRILPYNSVTFDKGIVIGDAYDVRVTYEINGERRLDFSHPINEKSEIISENKIVVCEGQAYRIIKVSKQSVKRILLRRNAVTSIMRTRRTYIFKIFPI